MTGFIVLAAEAIGDAAKTAADVVASDGAGASSSSFWKLVAAFLGGVVATKVVLWLASWFEGKGAKYVQDQLSKFEQKLDSTGAGAQIAADNALFDIAKAAIPVVTATLAANVRADLQDGKFDKVNWDDIGAKLWAATKPQIQGGVHDYLKISSFKDGAVVMAWIAKLLFHKDKAEKEAAAAAAAVVVKK